MQYGESHPVLKIAARWMSYRSVFEQIDPATSSQYNGYALTGIVPQTQDSDRWTKAEQNTLLNNGVTPVTKTTTATVIVNKRRKHHDEHEWREFPHAWHGTTIGCGDFVRHGLDVLGANFRQNPRITGQPGAGQRPLNPTICDTRGLGKGHAKICNHDLAA